MSDDTAGSFQPRNTGIPLINLGPSSGALSNASPKRGSLGPRSQSAPSTVLNNGSNSPGPSLHANGATEPEKPAFVKRDPPVPSPGFPTEVE